MYIQHVTKFVSGVFSFFISKILFGMYMDQDHCLFSFTASETIVTNFFLYPTDTQQILVSASRVWNSSPSH